MTAITLPTTMSNVQTQATALVPANGSTTLGTAFSTVMDALNPLQHIPVVSSIYRSATGASISSVSQVAGDTLYGGLVGGALSSFVSSVADVAVKAATGNDITGHIIATVEDATGSSRTASTTAVTALIPSASPTPAQASAAQTSADLKGKVNQAVSMIYRQGAHPERVAAQYQRAQTLDTGNKILASAI